MSDFLVRGSLKDVDPDVKELIDIEAARQANKLILIPSESYAPESVREALGSVFQNLYAEGYPDAEMSLLSEDEILDYDERLAHYRRYSDPRYYKGVEYVDIVETLAKRRCAEAFATPTTPAEKIFVNVQPLSGAPANNAVYTGLITPGDTILGMNLLHGGHLTHGSSVNRSGMLFNVIHYNVDPVTEKIDYDVVQALATEHKPKIIIAGYSSYSWVPDWKRFREIADSVGAYLLADISHIAGLIASGVIPSPVGHAHIISFTTHKTLIGPRSACILTTNATLAKKIDKGVFPGEQGGPHVHAIAALATTFKIAKTEKFKVLQQKILDNCVALTAQLKARGFRIPFDGTNTHLGNLDCKTVVGPDGSTLSGDLAARILDIAGIVLNRNTIPGDKTALKASGIRYGTPWMTQRGLDEGDMVEVANIIADVLQATIPYNIETRKGPAPRAKVDFIVLENAKLRVKKLADKASIDHKPSPFGYPHFYYLTDVPASSTEQISYLLKGTNVKQYVSYVFASNTDDLKPGEVQKTQLQVNGEWVEGYLACVSSREYQVTVPHNKAIVVATWLRDLSDGFVNFDKDITRRIPGPVVVKESEPKVVGHSSNEAIDKFKPYYIGLEDGQGDPLPQFEWTEDESPTLKRTPLFDTHVKLGAKIVPFAGWEMPVWYTSVVEEHMATRESAGLFDVAHMGVYQAEGPEAALFLDSVCANDISGLAVGESCYTHFLDPHANVIDDLLVYRRREEMYLVVVNASNDDKDWAWLQSVIEGQVMVDQNRPWVKSFGRNVRFRNLRDPKEGADMRVDIALQGKKSRDILLSLGCTAEDRSKIMALKRTELCEAVVGGLDLVVSRTGYTGEGMAFELFVHPDKSVELWEKLMAAGTPVGLKPCGLGARDSLRTEFGLPLYGHEMGGDLNLGVAEAGFGSYVKTYKPWFIGRDAFIAREKKRTGVVARFRFEDKRVRMAHHGDPVLDGKGKVIGVVTSCAIDKEGFLTGQAFLDEKSAVEGTEIYIFQGSPDKAGKAPAELVTGDRVNLPSMAIILSRYLKLK